MLPRTYRFLPFVVLLLVTGPAIDSSAATDSRQALDSRTKGDAKIKKDDYAGAIADYTQAIELRPTLTKPTKAVVTPN